MISPDPMVVGSCSRKSAKYASRIEARSLVRLLQSNGRGSVADMAVGTLPPPELQDDHAQSVTVSTP
jgi:hypothetical protein